MLSLVFSFLESVIFFSHPLVHSLVSLPSDTCVSGDKCPSVLHYRPVSVIFLPREVISHSKVQSTKFTITLIFTACTAKPTAWKRGCGKCHGKFPIFKKSVLACTFGVSGSVCTQIHMAANVGPKAEQHNGLRHSCLSSSHMERRVQCAEQQDSSSNIIKYGTCHEK